MDDGCRLPGLGLKDAIRIVEFVLESGAESGFAPLAAAVVDPAGEVIVLQRADGAHPMTSRIAVAKARTTLVSLLPSGACENLPAGIQDAARALYGGDFVTRAGGLAVSISGLLQAAVGVSGAASEEDEAVAIQAIERWRTR